jgi:hypothetical protein
VNRDPDDLVVYVGSVFSDREENGGVSIVVVVDNLLFIVDDYWQKKVKQRGSLYAPHCDEDEDWKSVRKELPHFSLRSPVRRFLKLPL